MKHQLPFSGAELPQGKETGLGFAALSWTSLGKYNDICSEQTRKRPRPNLGQGRYLAALPRELLAPE